MNDLVGSVMRFDAHCMMLQVNTMIIGGDMAYTFLTIKDTQMSPASARSAVTVMKVLYPR